LYTHRNITQAIAHDCWSKNRSSIATTGPQVEHVQTWPRLEKNWQKLLKLGSGQHLRTSNAHLQQVFHNTSHQYGHKKLFILFRSSTVDTVCQTQTHWRTLNTQRSQQHLKLKWMAYLYLWHLSTYSRGSTAGPTISIISLHTNKCQTNRGNKVKSTHNKSWYNVLQTLLQSITITEGVTQTTHSGRKSALFILVCMNTVWPNKSFFSWIAQLHSIVAWPAFQSNV